MGFPQPIVFSEILEYADEYGIFDADQRDRLIYFVQELDSVHAKHVAEKRKTPTDTNTKS